MFNIKSLFKPTGFVSELDRFMMDFDKTHQLSASQRKEIKKYDRVFRLRDDANPVENKPILWEKF